jgi:phosphatidylethanolamine/phosphatidyl-N-methylethanolamine N-methyltransferase
MQARVDRARGGLAQGASDRAYSRWAPFYDLIFDLPFHPGRLAAARAASAAAGAGGKILVVGVGTGLELGLLRRDARVTGIDVSEPMLKVARDRVARKRFAHVWDLRVLDAAAMDFADAAFDVALAPYVLSVVPEPARVLDEMWRITRPGGSMIVMNHFAAERGLRARTEALLEGAGAWLGWHPNFPASTVTAWLDRHPEARLSARRELAPFRLFTLLRIDRAV